MSEKEIEKQAARLAELMQVIDPWIGRQLAKLQKEDGDAMALSVAANVGTGLLAYAIANLVNNSPENTAEFINTLLDEITRKVDSGIENTEKRLHARAMAAGPLTCQKLH